MSDRYWWHKAIVDELVRLEQCAQPAGNIKAIAGNLRMPTEDVARYVDQLVGWGELERCAALWAFAPDTWVRVAS